MHLTSFSNLSKMRSECQKFSKMTAIPFNEKSENKQKGTSPQFACSPKKKTIHVPNGMGLPKHIRWRQSNANSPHLVSIFFAPLCPSQLSFYSSIDKRRQKKTKIETQFSPRFQHSRKSKVHSSAQWKIVMHLKNSANRSTKQDKKVG